VNTLAARKASLSRAAFPPQDLVMRNQYKVQKTAIAVVLLAPHRRSSPEEIDVKDCACFRFGGTPLTNGEATHHTKPRAIQPPR
jgi:hypothetical protein